MKPRPFTLRDAIALGVDEALDLPILPRHVGTLSPSLES